MVTCLQLSQLLPTISRCHLHPELYNSVLMATHSEALPLRCMFCRIKSRLQQKLRESGSSIVSQSMDWRALGVPDWLADRAERLGFMFPTGQPLAGLKPCCS